MSQYQYQMLKLNDYVLHLKFTQTGEELLHKIIIEHKIMFPLKGMINWTLCNLI